MVITKERIKRSQKFLFYGFSILIYHDKREKIYFSYNGKIIFHIICIKIRLTKTKNEKCKTSIKI